jgi:hypothetical protein
MVWMLIGAFAGFWIGLIPVVIVFDLALRFLKPHDPFIGLVGILQILFIALGASWFKRLFYKGMLWGYQPDPKS